jgi:hypothetical protein
MVVQGAIRSQVLRATSALACCAASVIASAISAEPRSSMFGPNWVSMTVLSAFTTTVTRLPRRRAAGQLGALLLQPCDDPHLLLDAVEDVGQIRVTAPA